MPATAPAPTAPAAPPPGSTTPGSAGTPGTASAIPSSSKATIHVGAGSDASGKPPEPAKPGSVRDQMFASLRGKAKPAEGEAEVPAAVTKPGAPQAREQAEKPPEQTPEKGEAKPGEEPPEKPGEQPDPNKKPAAPADPAKDTEKNPWRLVDKWKARAAKAESDLQAAQKGALPPEKIKEMDDQRTALQKRIDELEGEIKFVDYSKSAEFKAKFEQPYEETWKNAMVELKELTVSNPDGSSRAFAAQDLLNLVNMPLVKARELATELFGDSAGDVMDQRKEIRKLFDAKTAALEEARKNGSQREQQRNEERQRTEAEAQQIIKSVWEKENTEIVNHPKVGEFFKPVDGDDELNTALQKGYAFVDETFGLNPAAEKLTAEQRADIVRRHAAMRNRAAAFTSLTIRLARERAEKAELRKKLAEYEKSEPTTKGAEGAPEGTPPASAREQVFANLRARAK
jgi:hypothetical protein